MILVKNRKFKIKLIDFAIIISELISQMDRICCLILIKLILTYNFSRIKCSELKASKSTSQKLTSIKQNTVINDFIQSNTKKQGLASTQKD